jgi:hypothetical protein
VAQSLLDQLESDLRKMQCKVLRLDIERDSLKEKMIVRLWKAQVKSTALPEYEENERNRSAPMFREQSGCIGVLFLRSADMCSALTFWSDWDAVDRLKTSKSYLQASAFYAQSGMLVGEPSLEVFEVKGGFLLLPLLEAFSH